MLLTNSGSIPLADQPSQLVVHTSDEVDNIVERINITDEVLVLGRHHCAIVPSECFFL